MMKTKILILLAFVLTTGLQACSNTADGFGKDMEGAGQKIQHTF